MSSPCAFQWPTADAVSSASTWPMISSIVRKPSVGHQPVDLLGDELEERDDELG